MNCILFVATLAMIVATTTPRTEEHMPGPTPPPTTKTTTTPWWQPTTTPTGGTSWWKKKTQTPNATPTGTGSFLAANGSVAITPSTPSTPSTAQTQQQITQQSQPGFLQTGNAPSWVTTANQAYTNQQDMNQIQQKNQPAVLQTGNAPQWVLDANAAVERGDVQPANMTNNQPTQAPSWIPSWLLPKKPAKPDYNRTPPGNIPTSSVLAAGGTLAMGPNNTTVATNPAIYPTGSMLSGAGDVNTGIPYFPTLPGLDDQTQGNGGFGSQYGNNWGRRRGGYGYGGGGGYGGNYQPAFGLNSWNFGE